MTSSTDAKFDALYKAHSAVVRRCVAGFGLPRDVWPDILQDVWLTATRSLDEVLTHPRPEAWLCTVARNHAMHYMRSYQRRQRKHSAVAAEPIRSDADDPFRERDAWDTLARLLAACPLEQREVYLKIELHGMTPGEVAEELGISVNTVHSRLRLTRQRLRNSSAALAALFIVLRASLAREDLGGLPNASIAAALASASDAPSLQRARMGGTASKATLIALLILSASESPYHDELRPVARPVASKSAAMDEPPPSLARVYPRVIHIPQMEPQPIEETMSIEPPRRSPAPSPRNGASERRKPQRPSVSSQRLAPLDDGMSLLAAAQEAYRAGRYERALARAEELRRIHPASELRSPCEALIVRALCQLGRDPEARGRLRAFARESPDERAFRARLGTLPEQCR